MNEKMITSIRSPHTGGGGVCALGIPSPCIKAHGPNAHSEVFGREKILVRIGRLEAHDLTRFLHRHAQIGWSSNLGILFASVFDSAILLSDSQGQCEVYQKCIRQGA